MQKQWTYQWARLKNDLLWIFEEWIYPSTVEGMKGKTVLDAGCGRGDHVRHVARRGSSAST